MLADIMGPDGLIILVAVVVVLMFGGKKLPTLARSLGGASHEFKKGLAEGDGSIAPVTTPGAPAPIVNPPTASGEDPIPS